MILEKIPLTMAEVQEKIEGQEGREELSAYLKKFTKLNKEDALKVCEEIEKLDNPKIKKSDLAKIADFLPTSQEEANKVLSGASLSEEEATQLTEITKRY